MREREREAGGPPCLRGGYVTTRGYGEGGASSVSPGRSSVAVAVLSHRPPVSFRVKQEARPFQVIFMILIIFSIFLEFSAFLSHSLLIRSPHNSLVIPDPSEPFPPLSHRIAGQCLWYSADEGGGLADKVEEIGHRGRVCHQSFTGNLLTWVEVERNPKRESFACNLGFRVFSLPFPFSSNFPILHLESLFLAFPGPSLTFPFVLLFWRSFDSP